MNFSNIKYFLVAAEEMNITKAADRLHISQQALSNHITKIEKELGTRLFERTPNLVLTYAGKCLVHSGSQILDSHNQFLAEIDDINGNCKGELTIGVTHTRGQALLPLLLPSFMKSHPLIQIKIEEGNAADLESSLQHGFIDLVLGFLPFRSESAVVTELSKEHMFLIVPRNIMDHLFKEKADEMRQLFSQGTDITPFQDQPFILLKRGDRIRTILDNYFRKQKMTPNILLETQNIQTAFALCLEGLGICVYPEMYLRGIHTLSSSFPMSGSQKADYFPLSGTSTIETLAIGYNKERYLTKAATEFIAMAKELLG